MYTPEPSLPSLWPDWLEDCRTDDDAMAEAYAAVSPRMRAAVKQSMAFCHAWYGEGCEAVTTTITDRARGFQYSRTIRPAPWALLLFPPSYAAASRMAAALMPAILAHVPAVGACCVGGEPGIPARLALELAGVEDSFCISAGEAEKLLSGLCRKNTGRLILLHQGELEPLALLALRLELPCFEELRPPRLIFAEGADEELIRFAHGETAVKNDDGPGAPEPNGRGTQPGRVAAVGIPEESRSSNVPATAGSGNTHLPAGQLPAPDTAEFRPGMEGCWLHTRLPLSFFQSTALTADSLTFSGDNSVPTE